MPQLLCAMLLQGVPKNALSECHWSHSALAQSQVTGTPCVWKLIFWSFITKTKPDQAFLRLLFMVKFCPTALNFGYGFVLIVHSLGTPCILISLQGNQKSCSWKAQMTIVRTPTSTLGMRRRRRWSGWSRVGSFGLEENRPSRRRWPSPPGKVLYKEPRWLS